MAVHETLNNKIQLLDVIILTIINAGLANRFINWIWLLSNSGNNYLQSFNIARTERQPTVIIKLMPAD
jgi:hypothetical protein